MDAVANLLAHNSLAPGPCDVLDSVPGVPLAGPACTATDEIRGIPGDIAGSALDGFSDSIAHAVSDVFAAVTSFWVRVPTPGLTQRTCELNSDGRGGVFDTRCTTGPNDTLAFLWDHLSWFWGLLLVFSVLFAASKLAWTQRKDAMGDLVRSLVTFVVTTTAGVAALGLAIRAGDEFSVWIIDAAAGDDLGEGLLRANALPGLGSGLIIVLGILGIILGGVQIVLMIFRMAILTLMLTFLPLAAAATNTDWGRNWFRKVVGWTVAFVLYKPVAAIIYAAAYRLLSAGVLGGDALISFATGLAMMCMAIFALPALMKAAVPAVASLGSGGGSGVGAVMAIGATGAAMVASGGASSVMSGVSAAGGVTRGGSAAAGASRAGVPGPRGATQPLATASSPGARRPAAAGAADAAAGPGPNVSSRSRASGASADTHTAGAARAAGASSGWETAARTAQGTSRTLERVVEPGEDDGSPSGADR